MNLVNAGISFGAGVVSITSPCTVPLLPGYLGFLSGVTGTQTAERRRRALLAALLFVGGFTVVFAGLGVTASVVAHLLIGNRPLLDHIAGGVNVMVGGALLLFPRRADLWAGR